MRKSTIVRVVKAAVTAARKELGFIDNEVQRRLREALKFREEEKERTRVALRFQQSCSHLDKSGRETLQLQHNFPDGSPRGVCSGCQIVVHPAEWRHAATPKEALRVFNAIPKKEREGLPLPQGSAYAVPAHPLYNRVIAMERHLESFDSPTAQPSTTIPESDRKAPSIGYSFPPVEAPEYLADATPAEIMEAWKAANTGKDLNDALHAALKGSDPSVLARLASPRVSESNKEKEGSVTPESEETKDGDKPQ